MKKARACFADGGQISKADQMIAEMNAKYGVSGNSQPAPPPVAQPAPQPQPEQKQNSKGLIGDALNLFGNRQKQIDKAAGYADGGLIRDAAEYWANDNAEFEKTNPGFVSRVVRGINPMTGFGSAMGAMHTAASNGDIPGMVMSGIQAIPAVGIMRTIPASGAVKASVAPGIGKTVSAVFGGGAVNAAADEFSSEKNKGYANGGLIQGIGSPTSDSIDAQVNETGEPIKVSTKERIVSHEQDKLLQRLAKAMGFESVDALFEAGTGKPVGPTIKGGKKAAAGGWSLDNNPDEYAKAMQATRNTLSIPSLSTNNSAAQGGIYKDVGLPAISMGAGQAPTIYDNGGLPTKTDRVSGSLPVATAQNSVSPSNDGPRPWYAGASSADNRTGLEMERGRRAEATSAGVMNDPVKSALQYGVVGQNGTAQASAQSPVHASNPLSAGVLSNYGNEGRSVPAPITKQNPSAIVDNQFTEGGRNYTVNPTSQDGIKRVTAQGTSPLYTNIDPQKAVVGLKDPMIGGDAASVNEGLARYANANKIRGEMIANRDKDIPAGGYGPGILGDGGIEAANAEKTARWRQDDLLRLATRGNQAAIGALLNSDGHRDVAAMNNETARQNAGVAAQRDSNRDQVIMRGQDLNAQNELLRLQGNPLDNQTKQLSLTRAQQIGKLQDAVLNGKTPEEQAAAAAKIRAISGKQDREDRTVKPMEIADPKDPTGQRKILVRPNDDGTYTLMKPKVAPIDEYQAAITAAKGDPAKIKLIQERARQNGVIQ